MDVMSLRRGLMMGMAQGIKLPSYVEVKTFTLEQDSTGNSNFSIPNPFGRVDMKTILCMNFIKSPTTNSQCVGFVLTTTSVSDNASNRKLAYIPSNARIEITNYTAIQSITEETITLRNTGIYNWTAGTYYMFAW